MPDRHSHVPGIVPARSHGWIQPDGGVDIEVWFIRHTGSHKYFLEAAAVITAQEQVMRTELGVLLVQAPVEHDGRAAVLLSVDPVGCGSVREQVPVYLTQVGV